MSIWWWRNALSAPALLHALLFLSAGHQAAIEGSQGDVSMVMQKSSRDSVRYRVESLHILNEILGDPIRAITEANILVVAAHHSIEVRLRPTSSFSVQLFLYLTPVSRLLVEMCRPWMRI
jgi:hypothetical protein